MNGALQIGPLSLPWMLLLVLAALLLAHAVGLRLSRRAGVDVEPSLLLMLVLTVVVARLAFVYEYRSAYVAEPLGILDIRDGGWSPMVGLTAAALYALHRGTRQPALRRPLWAAFGSGTALYAAGSVALAMLGSSAVQTLPAVPLARLDGQNVNLQAYAGQPVVVNLWATWCPPCRREMPVLAAAQRQFPQVHFVYANQGESAQRVQAYLAGERPALRNVLLDARGELPRHLGQRALPTTLFYDARGTLVDVRIGEVSQATLHERLARMGVKPTPAEAQR